MEHNYPENNCCVCGAGLRSEHETLLRWGVAAKEAYLCITAGGDGLATVLMEPCDRNKVLQWWQRDGALLRSKPHPGQCLESKGGAMAISECDEGAAGQHWSINTENPHGGQIQQQASSAGPLLCLDAAGSWDNEDAVPRLQSCVQGEQNQTWATSKNSVGNMHAWRQAWRRHMATFATFAQEVKAEMLGLGMEINSMTERVNNKFWRSVVADVRRLYSGKVTYCADWPLMGPPLGAISWWDAVDAIAIDGYYPLAKKALTEDRPAQILARFVNISAALRNISHHYNKPVFFSEVGYRSAAGSEACLPLPPPHHQ